MKPAPFSYHRARSAEEAVSLLAELGDDAKLLAGGQSLVAMMNFRLARPAALVDISRLTGLRYVREHDGELRIGARNGTFPGMVDKRTFNVRWISDGARGAADFDAKPDQTVEYVGAEVVIHKGS